MALKQLILTKRIAERKNTLAALTAKGEELTQRRSAINQRGEELTAAVEEITEATSAEDQAAVMAEVDAHVQTDEALTAEEADNERERQAIEREISDMEAELETLNQRATGMPTRCDNKKEMKTVETRKFFGMNTQERDAFFAREDVRGFVTRVRELAGQNRAVTGAELTIPQVILGVMRENVLHYSKLYRHVNVVYVNGTARQIIMGTVPEAVWTEMCANLNELNLTFNDVEVDGYKVGGCIAVCNATLQDSDVALGSEIITALTQAIGIALDKAILYGKGIKMPMGILPRLAQTTKPSDYPANARPWADLSTTNIITIPTSKTGVALFQAIMTASGAAKGKYSRGEKFWAMNETTYTKLVAEAMNINAAGAITAGVNVTMPVIGGALEVLPFIPNNVVIGGYGDLYLLTERAGVTVGMSEHVRFIQDRTVYKATARYDGMPVIPEGFVAIGLEGATPSATAVTFAGDTANP